MSDGSSEVIPLLIHLNPVDKTSNEPNEVSEKKSKASSKTFPSHASAVKKPFSPLATKSKKPKTSLPSSTKTTVTLTDNHTQYKEQSDDSLSVISSKIPRIESNSLKSSSTSVTKSQCVEVKPVLNSSDVKMKKLKTSADTSSSSVSKSTNDHSEFSRPQSYDADEYFLLSLAPDLRRLTSRQKYEVKSKMLDIVSEQYLKS